MSMTCFSTVVILEGCQIRALFLSHCLDFLCRPQPMGWRNKTTRDLDDVKSQVLAFRQVLGDSATKCAGST